MRDCTLEEIIAGGLCAECTGPEGEHLRYRPQMQRAGVGRLVGVRWPAVWGDGDWRLLEVFRSGHDWGCLPARVAGNGFPTGAGFRLPHIPCASWRPESAGRSPDSRTTSQLEGDRA